MDTTLELTIVIPVRIDCRERKENLDAVIRSLIKIERLSIIILEADVKQKYLLCENCERIKYVFISDDDCIFHRTRYLNILLKMSPTDVVGVWDTDVLLDERQLKEATDAINNGVTLCYPYDGSFLFLNSEQSEAAKKNVTSFFKEKNKEIVNAPRMGRPSVGGAFLINKHRYLQLGGENEEFYGWGPEDAERFKRMEIFEQPISRISGNLFHLYHPRGINSTFGNDERDKKNVTELVKICRMDINELKKYIATWRWKEQ